ncbi:hypothetical protein TTHERM_000787227 (macronuclear) [Tetrahymena thermophila SB210]|uniref:Uncharacterized protein n=1 Tax=Tetrahymena thermophila (strain SB210) TaxID=312017 RepID=W7XFL3_TETTS|nr:hypothetical protein TTHERM_000787227 [Tetrahymena thermophila SB210]EWS72791.1 hypothetical protein TTHERM_000787227 [Tetrahymena thermophila SB210]|eukprot:XP_012654678.1 hypothetical protein TTHERM_000787227 [Tetrahymena thermophila SB210]
MSKISKVKRFTKTTKILAKSIQILETTKIYELDKKRDIPHQINQSNIYQKSKKFI